ncbi:MAG: hypothetical protein SGI73_13050 [Chloroflexota bacterium]|nr:hypothetical protein [Chloroflexota bacterium]
MRSLPYGMHLLTYPDFDGEKAFLISLLPQGADFIAHIPALIEQLPDVLPVPKDALDFSLDSLKHFDHAIRKVGITNCYSPIIIPPMIAYGGEVLRRATHSEWEMRQPRDFPNVWEPWLRDKRGIYRAPWYAVVSALDKPPISIAGDLQFELRSPRIPTGNSSPDSTPYDTIYLTSASAATPAPDSSPAPAPKPAD